MLNDLDNDIETKINSSQREIRTLKMTNAILIILIILIFLLCFLSYKMGHIGLIETFSGISTDVIEISQDDSNWNKLEKLNIFNNSKFNGKKIIAPNSNEIYKFAIKNMSDNDIEYDIVFEDESTQPINMKYKLKMNNVYIAGNKENWVTAEELRQENIQVKKGSNNVFLLEWKWIDGENDTYIGTLPEEYYTLKINVIVKGVNEEVTRSLKSF